MSARITTPENTEKEIIRLRKQGKSYDESVRALKDGGFKTASGAAWSEIILRNLIARMTRTGVIEKRYRTKVNAAAPLAGNKKQPAEALLKLKSKGSKIETRYMTAMLRIPVEINLGTAEFRVLSLEK